MSDSWYDTEEKETPDSWEDRDQPTAAQACLFLTTVVAAAGAADRRSGGICSLPVRDRCTHPVPKDTRGSRLDGSQLVYLSVTKFGCLRCLSSLLTFYPPDRMKDLLEEIIRKRYFHCLQHFLEYASNTFDYVVHISDCLSKGDWKVPSGMLPVFFTYSIPVPDRVLWRALHENNYSTLRSLAMCFHPVPTMTRACHGSDVTSVRVLIKSWVLLEEHGVIPDMLKIVMSFIVPEKYGCHTPYKPLVVKRNYWSPPSGYVSPVEYDYDYESPFDYDVA